MRTFFYFITTLTLIFNSYQIQAQTTEEAPSLSIGLDKMIFSKGTIDVEVLSSIISKKQDELKKELVKRAMLDFLGKGSFTFQNYGENVLKLVLNEKNKQVLTREILEYTSNLALVYGFTELYLQLGVKTNNQLLIDIIITHFDLVKTADPNFQESGLVKYLRKVKSQGYKREQLPRYNKLFLLGELKHRPIKLTNCGCSDTELYGLNHILLDMVFDICKNEDIVQKKGFFVQALNTRQSDYQTQNKYLATAKCLLNIPKVEDMNTLITTFENYVSTKIIQVGQRSLRDSTINSLNFLKNSSEEVTNLVKRNSPPLFKLINSLLNERLLTTKNMLQRDLGTHINLSRDRLDQLRFPWLDDLNSVIDSLKETLATSGSSFEDYLQSYTKFKSYVDILEITPFLSKIQKENFNNWLSKNENKLIQKLNREREYWAKNLELLKKKKFVKSIPIFKKVKDISELLVANKPLKSFLTLKDLVRQKQIDSLQKLFENIDKDDILGVSRNVKDQNYKKLKLVLQTKMCHLYKNNVEKLKQKMGKTITTFFKFYEVLKETNFLKGNSIEEITKVYNQYLDEEANGKGKVQTQLRVKQLSLESEKLSLQNKINISITSFRGAVTNLKNKIDNIKNNLDTVTISLDETTSDNLNKSKQLIEEISPLLIRTVSTTEVLKLSTKVVYLKTLIQDLNNKNIINIPSTSLETFSNSQKLINLRKTKESNQNTLNTIENNLKKLNIRAQDVSREIKSLKERSTYFQINIRSLKETLLNQTFAKLKDSNRTLLKEMYTAINKLENPNKKYNDLGFANYILDSLNSQLAKYGYLNKQVKEAIKDLELIATQIKLNLLGEFKKAFDDLQGINFVNPSQFIDFITKLNQLDKADTYDYLFKVLIDIGNNFVKKEHSLAFNSIVNNVKKYTEITPDSSSINVDVEQIIVDLYDRYGNNSKAIIVPYFSIGLNQAYPINRSIRLSPTDSLNNFGFAGEKIGIKIRPPRWNFKSKYDQSLKTEFIQKREPFVSDMHFILYGSGLLYNLANAKTNQNFDGSLIGTSLGISFFNGLDFNAGIAFPIGKGGFEGENVMFNIGFDIKITEYIQGVREKRRLAKEKQNE